MLPKILMHLMRHLCSSFANILLKKYCVIFFTWPTASILISFLKIELDKITQQSQLPEVVPSTSSRSSKTWPKDSTFMFAVISSILCFPPFGVLTFIKSRQVKINDDFEIKSTYYSFTITLSCFDSYLETSRWRFSSKYVSSFTRPCQHNYAATHQRGGGGGFRGEDNCKFA